MTKQLAGIIAFAFVVSACPVRAEDAITCPGAQPPKNGGVDFSLPCVPLPYNPIPEADQQVFFASGSASLTSKAINTLDRQADLLKQSPSLLILLQGEADTREALTSEEMFRLSQKRAEVVRDYLIGRGVRAERIKAKGNYGPSIIPKKEDEQTLARMRFVRTGPQGQ